MTEPFNMEIPWNELINRGLNKKALDLTPQINKYLKAIITDEIKKRFPKYKFYTSWHYKFIKWNEPSMKYIIVIAPGFPTLKG